MDPVIVVNIYLNQDGTAASSGAPSAVVARGVSATPPGVDIPPPPTADPTGGFPGEAVPAPPAASSDQDVALPPVPSMPGDPPGQDVPPPPTLDAEPSGGNGTIPPPPDA